MNIKHDMRIILSNTIPDFKTTANITIHFKRTIDQKIVCTYPKRDYI